MEAAPSTPAAAQPGRGRRPPPLFGHEFWVHGKGDDEGELLTQLEAISAIHVEVVVAGLPLPAVGVEDEAIGAEAGLGHAVVTLVVLIALLGVFEGAVPLGADEGLGWESRLRE